MTSSPMRRLRSHSLILKESVASFIRNGDFNAAASLAYYGLFSLIPILLVAIYLLGHYILSSQTALKGLETVSGQVLPEANRLILNEVRSLFYHGEIWGITGFITLIWAIFPLMSAFRHVFSRIFKVSKRPKLLIGKLQDGAAVVSLLILFLFFIMTQIYYTYAVKVLFTNLPLLARAGNFIAPLIITTLFMAIFYLVICPVKLRFSHLLQGGFLTALLFTFMKPLFSRLVIFNPSFGIAFGSLKAIFILLLWVYYIFMVILFGAELIAHMRKREVLLLKRLFTSHAPPDDDLKDQMQRMIRCVRNGEVIVREGEPGDTMFYIISGTVTISRNEQAVKEMQSGEYFGEMAMLLNAPRNATATATEASELIIISQDNFDTLLREEPEIVMAVLKIMAKRLSSMTELL